MSTYAAVKSLSESLRMANAKYGIRICNLAPAKILTPLLLTVNTSVNDSQVISAEDLAKAALWIYQQPQTICIRDMVLRLPIMNLKIGRRNEKCIIENNRDNMDCFIRISELCAIRK
jgi:short-subunit dehydrogenase